MTAYDMTLTNRARIWALLCASLRSGAPAPIERLLERDVVDGEALLLRLAAGGLIEQAGDGYQLTAVGGEAAHRTLTEGDVPALVMHDPTEWRQRAWMGIRIHRTFAASDIASVADAPSYDAVQRYCADLVKAEFVVADGFAQRGLSRVQRYRLVTDPGPACPISRARPPADDVERDGRQHWRGRAWRACRRLGSTGQGFTSIEVSAASGVPPRRVQYLLEDLVHGGALAKTTYTGAGSRGGKAWLYALTLDAETIAPPIVARDPWQQRVWDLLLGATEPMTAQEVSDAVETVTPNTVRSHLDALVKAGHAKATVVETETKGSNPRGYVLTSTEAVAPEVPGRWKHRNQTARKAAAEAGVPYA